VKEAVPKSLSSYEYSRRPGESLETTQGHKQARGRPLVSLFARNGVKASVVTPRDSPETTQEERASEKETISVTVRGTEVLEVKW